MAIPPTRPLPKEVPIPKPPVDDGSCTYLTLDLLEKIKQQFSEHAPNTNLSGSATKK